MARLNGVNLVDARATIHIPRREPLPLDIDGQDIGEVDGDINIGARGSGDGRGLNVTVDIRLHRRVHLEVSLLNRCCVIGR